MVFSFWQVLQKILICICIILGKIKMFCKVENPENHWWMKGVLIWQIKVSSPLNYWKCKLPTWKIDLSPVRYYQKVRTIPCMWEGDQEKLVLSNTILFLLFATKACFYISFCEICSHTENWEEKQKMPICESQSVWVSSAIVKSPWLWLWSNIWINWQKTDFISSIWWKHVIWSKLQIIARQKAKKRGN